VLIIAVGLQVIFPPTWVVLKERLLPREEEVHVPSRVQPDYSRNMPAEMWPLSSVGCMISRSSS